MTPYALLVLAHAGAGSVGLVAFWTAALLRKGSPRHRRVGRVFLWAMAAVLGTGVPLAAQRVLDDRPVEAFFLAYLLVTTGQACWMAWRAVTDKADWRAMTARPAWRAWALACLGSGAVGLWLGLRTGHPVILGMSVIGPLAALSMWRFARRDAQRGNWHVVQHYQAILGAGVATHVAFLAIGMQPAWRALRAAWPGLPPVVVEVFPWATPLLVATVAGILLGRRYNRAPAKPRGQVTP